MTIKDLDTLRTDVATAIPDNTTGLVSPADVRSSIVDTIDSLQGSGASDSYTSYATLQTGYNPAAAINGNYRYVRDVDFQQNLTMSSQDRVWFDNCSFSGANPSQFTSCTNLKFTNCKWDTVTSANGAAIFDACTGVCMQDCEIADASYDALRIIDTTGPCSDFSITRLKVKTCCASAAELSVTLNRTAALEYSNNYYDVTLAHGALVVDGASDIRVIDCEFDDSDKTGVWLNDSSDVVLSECRITDCGQYNGGDHTTDRTSSQLDDSGILISNCEDVRIKGGYLKGYTSYGILIAEDVPDFEVEPTHTTINIWIQDMLVEGYASLGTASGYDNSLQSGIFVQGGQYVTVTGNTVRWCGETAIRVGIQQPVTYPRVENNNCYENGLSNGDSYDGGPSEPNLGLVHHDGISIAAAYMPICTGNFCNDNKRNGIQLKPGLLISSESDVVMTQLAHNVTVGNGYVLTGLTNTGVGLRFLGFDGEVQPSNCTVMGHVSAGNFLGNFRVQNEWSDIQTYGLQAGWTDYDINVSVVNASRIDFIGGMFHGWKDQAGTGQTILLSDNSGPVDDCRFIGTRLSGADFQQLNRENIQAAYDVATTPGTDDSRDALAKASIGLGYHLLIYNDSATAVTIPATVSTAVLGLTSGTGAPATITAGITDPWTLQTPNTPRSCTVTIGGTGIINGTIRVTGTDRDDAAISEDYAITASTAETIEGTKLFKTVTQVDDLTGQPGTATFAVGSGELIDLNEQAKSSLEDEQRAPGYGLAIDNNTDTITCQVFYVGSEFYDEAAGSGSGGDIYSPYDHTPFTTPKRLFYDGLSINNVDGVKLGNGFGPVFLVEDIADITTIDGDMTTGDLIWNVSGDATEVAGFIVDGSSVAQNMRAQGASPIHGELYTTNGSTAQTGIGTSMTLVTGFATNGSNNGTTPSASNDYITISQDGDYLVTFTCSGTGTASTEFEWGVTDDGGTTLIRRFSTSDIEASGGVVSVSGNAVMQSLSANDQIGIMIAADGASKSFTPEHMNLYVEKIA